MHKKAMSLVASLIALCGFALAIAIPTASAARAHATSTNCTYTEGTCSTTTTSTTTTATTTTATTTTTSSATPAVVTLPAGVTINTITTAQIAAILATIPGTSISPSGLVLVPAVDASLPAGTPLAQGVQVLSNSGGLVTISDNGVVFSVPLGAQLAVAPTGIIVVTIKPGTVLPDVRRAHATRQTVVKQTVIMPKGQKAQRFAYILPSGVSFGPGITWAKLATNFTVTADAVSGHRRQLRESARTTPFVVVAANKARSAFTLKTRTALSVATITFNLTSLKYSAAETKAITDQGLSYLTGRLTVKQGTTKPFKASPVFFSYGI